jgi:hypothetical protein
MSKTRESETRTQMAGMLREWKRSGEPATSFAIRRGITAAKFFYWKRVLGGGGVQARRTRSRRFVPVRLVGPGARLSADARQWNGGEGLVEIVLDSGERVRMWEGASEETLRRAIRVLSERC